MRAAARAPTAVAEEMVRRAERIDGVPQLILEKRHNDCFTNPNMDALMLAFDAERYVVYGVVTEICVKDAAFGLLERGRKVDLVTDAVGIGLAATMVLFVTMRNRIALICPPALIPFKDSGARVCLVSLVRRIK